MLRLMLLFLLFGCVNQKKETVPPIKPLPGWNLVWSDEFNYDGLPDHKKWSYDVGGNGWGNQELQYYTDSDIDNAKVGDGFLTITARRERVGKNRYTSARLLTRNRADWMFGRFEVRAKLPEGRGTWPAIWLLPTKGVYGSWPNSGEIDIMEHVGHDPNVVHANIHTKAYNHINGQGRGGSIYVDGATSSFHTYTMEWDADRIRFFVDGFNYWTFEDEKKGWWEYPFSERFHLILNIAIGGTWGGLRGVDDSIFPTALVIDYVRVYKKDAK